MERLYRCAMILCVIVALTNSMFNSYDIDELGVRATANDKADRSMLECIHESNRLIADITKELDPSVFRSCGIITDGFGHGSCVAIGPSLVLTAGHCVGYEGSWVEIDGVKYEIIEEWASKNHDVGFVRIRGRVRHLQLGEMPELLDEVYLIGSPYEQGFINSITKGVVSHLDRDIYRWVDLIQVDAEGAPGSSGCLLTDVNGKILGICVAGPNPGGGVTLCENVNSIKAALEEYNAERTS